MPPAFDDAFLDEVFDDPAFDDPTDEELGLVFDADATPATDPEPPPPITPDPERPFAESVPPAEEASSGDGEITPAQRAAQLLGGDRTADASQDVVMAGATSVAMDLDAPVLEGEFVDGADEPPPVPTPKPTEDYVVDGGDATVPPVPAEPFPASGDGDMGFDMDAADAYYEQYDDPPVATFAAPPSAGTEPSDAIADAGSSSITGGVPESGLGDGASTAIGDACCLMLAGLFDDDRDTARNDPPVVPVATSPVPAVGGTVPIDGGVAGRITLHEEFDGSGLDLGKFAAPATTVTGEGDTLVLRLGATLASQAPDATLERTLRLEPGARRVAGRLEVVDPTRASATAGTAPASVSVEIPLASSDDALMLARFRVGVDSAGNGHRVVVGLYVDPDGDGRLVALGETELALESTTPGSDVHRSTLAFAIDVGEPGRIELRVGDTSIRVPVDAALPAVGAALVVRLAARGSAGRRAMVETKLSALSIDGRSAGSPADRVVSDGPHGAVGHALWVADGAARLRTWGGTSTATEIILATRTDETARLEPLRQVETSRLEGVLTLRETSFSRDGIGDADGGKRGAGTMPRHAGPPSGFALLSVLFETELPEGQRFVLAGLFLDVIEGTDGGSALRATARLVALDADEDGPLDWRGGTTLAERHMSTAPPPATDASVIIEQRGDEVVFRWGGTVVRLPLEVGERWFPSVDNDAAALLSSAPGESVAVDIDRLVLTKR